MKTRICNICGKQFDEWDEQEDRGFHDRFGYGSKFDESILDLDWCCDCFDKMLEEYIIPKAKINPVIDLYGEGDTCKCHECEVTIGETPEFCGGHLPADGLTFKEGDRTIQIYCEDAATCHGCCGQCTEF